MKHKGKFLMSLVLTFVMNGLTAIGGEEMMKAKELFVIEQNGKCGYINIKGEIMIKPSFSDAKDFSEGLAAVLENRKWGYIDQKGKVVIRPQFEEAGPFSEGLASICTQLSSDKPPRCGFINRQGKVVIDLRFDEAGDFREGLARVTTGGEWLFDRSPEDGLPGIDHWAGGKRGYVNQSGVLVIEPQFDAGGDFSEGMVFVSKNGKWRCLNRKGNAVIKPEFEDAGAFSEGLAPVVKDGKWMYINKSGKTVIDARFFSFALSFSEGLAAVQLVPKMNDPKSEYDDYRWGYIDRSGKFVVQPAFVSAGGFVEGLACVLKKDKWGFIDKTGKMIIAPRFVDCATFSGGLARVTEDPERRQYGYINKTGTFVWKPSD